MQQHDYSLESARIYPQQRLKITDLNEDAYKTNMAALEQKMMHERQWDKELDRKVKEDAPACTSDCRLWQTLS
jgi:hypothetical protein